MALDSRKEKTRNRLRDAMTQLMREKPFEEISTTELVEVAQISRSSFYTHYQDKYELIEAYQRTLFSTIEYIFDKSNADFHATILETYEFLAQNPIYAALLSENGSKIIHQFMLQQLKGLLARKIIPEGHRLVGALSEEYGTTYYAHAIFGVTQAWLTKKKRETPRVMAQLLNTLIGE
ncbi:MAG: TetR/AcrR family transcriptional regulator [Streptococcaceae bacterium]|jgi:AcrR family transcriptional regulator|nr:TetR/AcrR family transcriptional regulator [Streptococcaceae bacterium]